MQRTLVVIPARMQSTRLPNKPLADIHGVPMIVHVWRRAMAAETGRVVVATDAQEIMAAITAAGGEAVMTRADHVSGSDRVFEAVNKIDAEGDFDIIATNPPYVRELDKPGLGANVRHEPEVALFGGRDGLLHLEGVLDTAVQKLRPHGWLVMEIGLGQEDDVIALASRRPALRLDATRCDLQGIPRTILFQREVY